MRFDSPQRRRHPLLLVAVLAAAPLASFAATLPAPTVTYSTVDTDGYSTASTNSVGINRNTLVTSGSYQFIAFYDTNTSGSDVASVKLGRRAIGSSAWSVFDTGLTANSVSDDHDNVAIALDGNGRLHMSWGMHNNLMNYRVSANAATGATWSAAALGLTTHSYWSRTAGNNDTSVTYPEFYNIPNSKDLLFVYRQGVSGNGDEYVARYNATTNTFAKNLVISGTTTNVNAYLNRLAYDSSGELNMTWTWRATPSFQTNHNIMFARSLDNGVTWTNQSGTSYALPITENDAQVVANIPQNSTLINQTSMTVDAAGNPIVATWYAPKAAQGDNTRQYMLNYFDGTQWRASQITNRPTEGLQDDTTVRDLGRPIVLVDDAGRTLVVMRYKDSASTTGGATPTSTNNNDIVVAISSDKQHWDYVTLATADMGIWEPAYDAQLWASQNKLSLFYEPLGTTVGSATVQVLDWDERAYVATLPEPATLAAVAGGLLIVARRRRVQGITL